VGVELFLRTECHAASVADEAAARNGLVLVAHVRDALRL
jgi:hypothetical protein